MIIKLFSTKLVKDIIRFKSVFFHILELFKIFRILKFIKFKNKI